MPYVTTRDDTKLFTKQWGTGKPVILIHGWPLNADSWDDVALGIANAGFRAIAYDRRGFGRSDQPWDGYDYDTLADDLAAVIDETAEGEKPAIVGFSMGGGEVARYLANRGSAKVSHAALIASIVPYLQQADDNPDGVPQAAIDQMKEQVTEDRYGFLQTFLKQFYGVGFLTKPVSQGVLDASFASAVMAGQWPTLACMNAFATTDFRADCAAFDIPTLIVHGTNDQTVPIDTSARAAAKLIPGAQMIEYDGAPHGLLATNKKEVIRDLSAFLGGGQLFRPQEKTEPMLADPFAGGLQPAY
jgi:non-heme chloroperoxidase